MASGPKRQTGPVEIREIAPADTDAVVALWEACGLVRPWNDPYRDIARKLAVADGLFLVAATGERVAGTVMAGYDGHRGWINYLAVTIDRRGEGLGGALLEAAERRLAALGCPKVNLQVRDTNTDVVGFYERLGYAVDPAISLGKRLESDERPRDEVVTPHDGPAV
jgi:ribosomal protein S18 acetylase RimI-like enzyme